MPSSGGPNTRKGMGRKQPCPGATNKAFGFIIHEQPKLQFQNKMFVSSTKISNEVKDDPKQKQVKEEAELTWATSLATPDWVRFIIFILTRARKEVLLLSVFQNSNKESKISIFDLNKL